MNSVTNLNQFKIFLAANISKDIFLSHHIHPERTRKTKLIHTQSNSFVIQSKDYTGTDINKHSWTEYGTAKTWLFKEVAPGQFDATKLTNDQRPIFTIEFRN